MAVASGGEPVRGASTISEQVVRMVHPRPRNVWSKWLETFEAYALERTQDKADILAFYLNQVPYGAERRGIVQAARYYFDRDLDTLSTKEMLALAVLARAPGVFAKPQFATQLETRIMQLAQRMQHRGDLTATENAVLAEQTVKLTRTAPLSNVYHFSTTCGRRRLPGVLEFKPRWMAICKITSVDCSTSAYSNWPIAMCKTGQY